MISEVHAATEISANMKTCPTGLVHFIIDENSEQHFN